MHSLKQYLFKKSFFFSFLFVLSSIKLFAGYQGVRGTQLIYFGLSPTIAGSGGVILNSEQNIDSLGLNPMAAAGLKNIVVNAAYSGLDAKDSYSNNNFALSLSLPTKIGVFSLFTSHYINNRKMGDYYQNTQLIFSKEISTKFKTGFSLNINATGLPNSDIPLGIYLNGGITYRNKKFSFSSNNPKLSNLGFFNPAFSILIKGIGFPVVYKTSEDQKILNPIDLRLGGSFEWLKLIAKNEVFSFQEELSGDIGLMTFLKPLDFNLVFGLVARHKFYFKNIFLKSISINTGYIFSQRINESEILGLPYYGWGTLGLNFKMLPGNIPIDFNYALLPEYENTTGYIHSFSFSFHLGKNDTQKPKINFGNLQDGGSIDDVPFEKLKENFF